MTLVRAIGFHWHAVQRDLLALGFRAVDMFTPKLTASEVVSIIVGAPSGTAVRHAFDGGYTVSDHLLATLSEQQAGLVTLQDRHQRPGVQPMPQRKARVGNRMFNVMSLDEFKKRMPHG